MRALFFSFVLLCTAAGHAQNWALLNPAYKYNYSDDGSDTISNQIFVTHIDTLGVDSFRYELNGVAELCDTCQGPQLFLRSNSPQFLQRTVRAGATVWHFSDPGSFVILPQRDIGLPWLFDTLANVQATVTIVDTIDQFGTSVARKTIQLSNGNVIQISEAFGILSWMDHSLIGVHGANVGRLIPPVSAFYPYQAGDVIQYRTDYGNCWPCNGYDSQFKITIAQAEDQDSAIAFEGWMTGYTHHYYEYGWNNYSHWYTYVDEATTWVTDNSNLPFFELVGSYPGQLIDSSPWQTGDVWSGLLCVARHGIDTAGRYTMRCEPIPGVGHFTMPISDPSGPLVEIYPDFEFCSEDQPPCGVEYLEGVGLVQYGGSFFETGESFVLDGTVVAGDTTGVILSDDQLLATQDALPTNRLRIFPDPASDRLTITSEPGLTGTWRISHMDGRSLQAGALSPAYQDGIDISSLPPGTYLFSTSTEEQLRTQRFIIAR